MPISFTPSSAFAWGEERAPAQASAQEAPPAVVPAAAPILPPRPPSRPRRRKAKTARVAASASAPRRGVPEQIRTVLIDRLEEATADGRIVIDADAYAAILAALFPEEFPAADTGTERPAPAAPTDTAPGSRERRIVYARRQGRGESLYHPGDLNPVADDRVVLHGRLLRRGSGQRFEITGAGRVDVAGDNDAEDDRGRGMAA